MKTASFRVKKRFKVRNLTYHTGGGEATVTKLNKEYVQLECNGFRLFLPIQELKDALLKLY